MAVRRRPACPRRAPGDRIRAAPHLRCRLPAQLLGSGGTRTRYPHGRYPQRHDPERAKARGDPRGGEERAVGRLDCGLMAGCLAGVRAIASWRLLKSRAANRPSRTNSSHRILRRPRHRPRAGTRLHRDRTQRKHRRGSHLGECGATVLAGRRRCRSGHAVDPDPTLGVKGERNARAG